MKHRDFSRSLVQACPLTSRVLGTPDASIIVKYRKKDKEGLAALTFPDAHVRQHAHHGVLYKLLLFAYQPSVRISRTTDAPMASVRLSS
ncbi:hypothetical protein BDW22DRAFT_1363130 [Trametopsis cervina]|nr:hypothetical protein BDW22DRAFT_1363130 [Trametopsis cervina]